MHSMLSHTHQLQGSRTGRIQGNTVSIASILVKVIVEAIVITAYVGASPMVMGRFKTVNYYFCLTTYYCR